MIGIKYFVRLFRVMLVDTIVVLLVGGSLAVIGNEAMAFWHARQNRQGEIVYGFALYERQLPPSSVRKSQTDITIPRSRVVNFYPRKIECEFVRDRRQNRWKDKRRELLNTERAMPAQLPVNRYQCSLFPMFYPAGMGWGMF